MSEHHSSIYKSGSVWRRWDPHIHAPGTAKEDGFGGDWDGYLHALEQASPRIEAIGITDYFTTRSFHRVLSHQQKGRLDGIFLFPNVELRVMPASKGAPAGVNIHLLIDPQYLSEVEVELEALTNNIDTMTFGCSETSLIRLGRHVSKNKHLDDDSALRAGVERFHLEFTALEAWLRRPIVAKHTIVAIAGGADGLGGISLDGTLAPRRRELARLSHAIFSSNPSEVRYWLGRSGKDPGALADEGGLKPCLHGSDAHDVSRVGRPHDNRYTWVKADPTFEGLRQTLYEPADRVHIGPSMPYLPDDDRVIESITIADGRGWIGNGIVHLNPYLTCIVGSKGSGKTALADLAALATNAWREEASDASFLAKASTHLDALDVVLRWRSGRESVGRLPHHASDMATEVQYLSQQFVEELCSNDRDGVRLRREVERVVFEHIPAEHRDDCLDFDSLVAERLEPVKAEAAEKQREISNLNQWIHGANTRETAEKPTKVRQLKDAELRIQELRKQMPTFIEDEHQRVASVLESEVALLEDQRRLERDWRDKIKKIEAQVRSFAATQRQWQADLDAHVSALRALGVETLPTDVKVPLFGELDEPTSTILAKIDSQLDLLLGQPVSDPQWTSVSISTSDFTISQRASFVEYLEAKLSSDKSKTEKIREINRLVASEERRVSNIRRDLLSIADGTSRVKAWSDARTDAYIAYFNTLQKHEEVLEALYKPLADFIASRKENDGLELHVRRTVDVQAWAEAGVRMLDLRKRVAFSSKEDIVTFARTHLLEAWHNGNEDRLRAGIATLVKRLFKDGTDILVSEFTRRDLANWVFGLSHVHIEYGIRYGGTALENLSPGSRGIVLLRLYLDLDVSDNRPLVIDQPEENLDNRSVYELLTRYFRVAKLRRQIIMVTHNPNLVVNTDAELVVVAECQRVGIDKHPFIRYFSGGLESVVHRGPHDVRSVRDEVCSILEGGVTAFQRREERYRASKTRTSSQ